MYEKVRQMMIDRVAEVDLLGKEHPTLTCLNCYTESQKVMRMPILTPSGDLKLRVLCPDCFLEIIDRYEEQWEEIEALGLAQ